MVLPHREESVLEGFLERVPHLTREEPDTKPKLILNAASRPPRDTAIQFAQLLT